MQVYLTLQSLVFNPIPPMKSEFRPLRSGEVQWGLVKMSRPKKQVFFVVCVCVFVFLPCLAIHDNFLLAVFSENFPYP